MIVNLRGTSGAGKSTVVREVVRAYTPGGIEYLGLQGRRQPYGYIHTALRAGISRLYVPGHYETPCGGCDTIKTVDEVYALVTRYAAEGFDVLYEGIMVQDDVRRAIEFSAVYKADFQVVALDTPIDVCLAGIQSRRDTKGDARPLNPKNTISRAKSVDRNMIKLAEAGVMTWTLSRETAPDTILKWFGWPGGALAAK